jgi:nicotinate-nucleotide pyrophosphorylase (carboxylating)
VTSVLARRKIREMLMEDIGSGDVTSEALITPKVTAVAEITAKQPGVLAGVSEAMVAFEEVGVQAKALKSDGQPIKAGDLILRLDGPARGILAAERVALNLLMRMSGIATATRGLIDRARKKNPNVAIAATRKTAPLLTYFDKRAVQVAGGEPHRYKLSDYILIKSNHLRLVGSVSKAVLQAREGSRVKKVEVEVSKPDDAYEAARAGADVVMLDNMKPTDIVLAIKALKRGGMRDRVTLEASGGIDPSNVDSYVATGVDVISSSYITMRAPALDMRLELKKQNFKPSTDRREQKSR